MPWKFTVIERIPLPSGIVGDQYPDVGTTPGSGYIPSALSGAEVDFDVKFEYSDGTDTAPVLSIIVPTNLGVSGITVTKKGADTINIKGTPVNIFTDEVFRFVFPDLTEKNLPPDNTEPWKSIIKWAPPSSREKLATYNFIAKYDDNPAAAVPIVGATEPAPIKQFFYWRYEPSLAYFKALVAKGPNYKE
jgi:hypothetical protein